MTEGDPYLILGLSPGADLGAVRRAYRRLARRHHPGLQTRPEDGAHFDRIVTAYRNLVESLAASSQGEATRTVARAWVFLPTRSGPGLAPVSEDTEREVVVEVGFGEAIRGGIASVTLHREELCPSCDGRGCGECGGRGLKVQLERLRVRFPPGVEDGARLRLARRAGEAGEPRQLYLKVAGHEYFRRSGLDTHGLLPVTYREAVLGAEVDVPTIEGPVRVRVPAGTAGGTRFRLAGRGVRTDRAVGDHYYTIEIAVPTTVSAEEEEWLRRLTEVSPREGLPKAPV